MVSFSFPNCILHPFFSLLFLLCYPAFGITVILKRRPLEACARLSPSLCVFGLRPHPINITCVSCQHGGQIPLSNYRDGLWETLVSVCLLPCLFLILAPEPRAKACLGPALSTRLLQQTALPTLPTISVKSALSIFVKINCLLK